MGQKSIFSIPLGGGAVITLYKRVRYHQMKLLEY
jgi:hypothetical protein